jgi:mRNA interferase RelE/StbE
MAAYSISLKPSVAKDLQGLPTAITSRVMQRIESLAGNPFPPGAVKLVSTERLYRVRVGDYRIIYEVDTEASLITVHYVRHRREVYRGI